MSKIRCMIIDDEPPAIALLENYVSMIDNIELVATAQSAVKAFDLVKTKEVDLLFQYCTFPSKPFHLHFHQ